MSHDIVFFILLCYLTYLALAGSSIEFNITQEISKGGNSNAIRILECNRHKVLNVEVEEASKVPVVIRFDGTAIEQASCYRQNPTNKKLEESIFTLIKANYTRESHNNGNTFKDIMNIKKEHQGLWTCPILIKLDTRFPTMANTTCNGRFCNVIYCQLNLIVIDDFFSKYKYWIIGGGSVGVLIIIIMITQTIVILQFRARVNATKHIRPLSLIGRRHDRNNYGRTPGSQRRTTSKEDTNHYEIVQAVDIAQTPARIQDISQRPPLPIPEQYDYEEPPSNSFSDGTLRSNTRTPSPPPINTLPKRYRPQPEFEEELPPPTPPVIEIKPPKADPMISELGNRLRKRRDNEHSPFMPKKSFKSPQQNIPPPVPSKPPATAHNMTNFETPHFLPPHQMPAKTSPHLRSREFLQPHTPSHKTPLTPPMPRQYIPEHICMQPEEFHMPPQKFHMQPEHVRMQRENVRMQPENCRMPPETFRMQHEQSDMQPNTNGNMSLPRRKPAPQNMMGMHNARFANHKKSLPDIKVALSAHIQQQHMKLREPQAGKIPPPVLRKAGSNLQAGPALCKPRFPSPRSTTIEENNAGSDEDWNYEDLPPVNKYLNDY